MSQNMSIEITDGTLLLDAATLKAAHIGRKARVVVNEHSIEVLPALEESVENDPVGSSFGIIKLPYDLARRIADDEELEYDL